MSDILFSCQKFVKDLNKVLPDAIKVYNVLPLTYGVEKRQVIGLKLNGFQDVFPDIFSVKRALYYFFMRGNNFSQKYNINIQIYSITKLLFLSVFSNLCYNHIRFLQYYSGFNQNL